MPLHMVQEKRESTIPGKDGLCFHFTRSNCSFGDRCKFSHDMLKYLGHRPPDLPGRCPFESLQECPYQVTCRWASTHRNPDALTTKWLFPHLRQASGAKHSGEMSIPLTTKGCLYRAQVLSRFECVSPILHCSASARWPSGLEYTLHHIRWFLCVKALKLVAEDIRRHGMCR